MSQVLEGLYYQKASQGYLNKGRQVITFPSKIKYLPVHSKCNKLLKSQSHPIEFLPAQRLLQVHCLCKSAESELQANKSINNQMNSKEQVKNRKQVITKVYKENIENIENNINININQKNREQVKQEQNLQEYFDKNDRSQQYNTSNKNQLQTPRLSKTKNISFNNLMQYENQEIQLNKNKNKKNKVKQTVCLTNLKKQVSQSQSQYNLYLNQQKTALHPKKPKQIQINKHQQQQQQTSDEQCATEHAVYQSYPRRNSYHLQNKMQKQFDSMLQKFKYIQGRIKQNQQQLKLKILQQEVNNSQSKLKALQQQNIKLKYPQFYKNYTSCQNVHQNNINLLYLFGMFLFGLIFTKAVFC